MQELDFRVPQSLVAENPTTMILSAKSSRFKKYGRIVESVVVDELLQKAHELITLTDEEKTYYIPSIKELEEMEQGKNLSLFFGGMDIEIGSCYGKNEKINGAEYHKSPELFIAVTDCLQFLSPYDELDDFAQLNSCKAEVFYFPKGSVALIEPNVLHLAPCSVHKSGFISLIVLPQGTNLPLDAEDLARKSNSDDPELRLLYKKNKYMLAHQSRTHLINDGVLDGLKGENRHINPIA
ncbi:MAG: DUF4867 family protein [Spirochaetia bacterium]|nr:DUF4867 family protein [Spirochaetia bacterium]